MSSPTLWQSCSTQFLVPQLWLVSQRLILIASAQAIELITSPRSIAKMAGSTRFAKEQLQLSQGYSQVKVEGHYLGLMKVSAKISQRRFD
jgi:hypothetical protein